MVEYTVALTDTAKAEVLAYVTQPSKEEVCGILVGRIYLSEGLRHHHVVNFAPVPNTAKNPVIDFAMQREHCLEALAPYEGYDIVGSLHTHPKGEKADASIADIEAMPDGMIGAVYHIATGMLTYYNNEVGFINKEKIK